MLFALNFNLKKTVGCYEALTVLFLRFIKLFKSISYCLFIDKFIFTGVVYDDNWIEVDFLSNVDASGVVTQGRGTTKYGNQHVASYQVQYKKDGRDNYRSVQGEDNQPVVSLEAFCLPAFNICYLVLYDKF